MAAAKKEAVKFDIPALRLLTVRFTLVGDSRLVTNRFHQAAIDSIIDKQIGKAVSKKEARKPLEIFMNSAHIIEGCTPIIHGTWEDFENDIPVYMEGRFGFPATGIKAAAVTAAKVSGITMTDARQAFFIDEDLCEIVCEPGPYLRVDPVTIGKDTTTIAFRPSFEEWAIPLSVNYNADVMTHSQVVNLFFRAGFGVGIGAFRPQKEGQWGRFHIGTKEEGYTIDVEEYA